MMREEKPEKSESPVPKITFKLGSGSSCPPSPESQHRKIVIKSFAKNEDDEEEEEEEDSEKELQCSSTEAPVKREPSPELARISALITRPPKTKPSSKPSVPKPEETVEPTTISISPTASSTSSAVSSPESPPTVTYTKFKKSPKPNPKFKAKDVTRKIGAEVEEQKEPVAYYYDNDGNKVWICPACGGQDDGSPMIGCDDCDAWYHWVCVGIQVPPDENEDWYCRVCIVRKQENIVDKKKKSRKKKVAP